MKILSPTSSTLPLRTFCANRIALVFGVGFFMKPIWKTLDINQKYVVSNTGLVKRNNRLLKQENHNSGYLRICLYFGSKSNKKKIFVHRLVGLCFLENNLNYKEINHIDGNKHNNNADNLEWCSHSMNAAHCYKIGLNPNKCEHFRTPVIQKDKQGNVIKEYVSITDAELNTGAKNANISKVCIGERRTAGGFIWEYKNK